MSRAKRRRIQSLRKKKIARRERFVAYHHRCGFDEILKEGTNRFAYAFAQILIGTPGVIDVTFEKDPL